MSRLATAVVCLAFLVPTGRADEAEIQKVIDAMAGTWVCIEEAGKKPDVEIMLVIDKKGGYKMAGKSGEQSQIARLAGVEEAPPEPPQEPPTSALVGPADRPRPVQAGGGTPGLPHQRGPEATRVV